MEEKKIIQLWRSGITKNKLAEIYRREYNQQIRLIRSSTRHRHDGTYISNYDALYCIERVIYEYLRRKRESEN